MISSVIDKIHLHGFGSSSINSGLESLGLNEKQRLKFKKPLGNGGYKTQSGKDRLFLNAFKKNDVISDDIRKRFLELLNKKPSEINHTQLIGMFPQKLRPYLAIHEFVLCSIDPMVADIIHNYSEFRSVVIQNKDGFLGKLLKATIENNPDDDTEFFHKANIELAIAIACAYEHDSNYISNKNIPLIAVWLQRLNNKKSLRSQYFEQLRKKVNEQGNSLQKLLDQVTHQEPESARKLITRWSTDKNRPSKAKVYSVFETLSYEATTKVDQLKLLNGYESTYKCILSLDYIFSRMSQDPTVVGFVFNRYFAISHALKVEAVTNWGASPIIDLSGLYSVMSAHSNSHAKFKDRYLCPCCYLPTLIKRRNHETCEICYWKDDGQDSFNADEVIENSNAGYSLTDARDNFKKYKIFYANDESTFEEVPNVKLKLIGAFKKTLITGSEEHWSEVLMLEKIHLSNPNSSQ